MEYNSRKVEREKLLSKAKRSVAAPFFNFVTENWCKVAAGSPTLDGNEVHKLLWQQWVSRLSRDEKIKEVGSLGSQIGTYCWSFAMQSEKDKVISRHVRRNDKKGALSF